MTGYIFKQLINVDHVRQLLESHHYLSGMAYGLFDNNGNNIVSSCWQEICRRFHRVHPICSERCRESDEYIKSKLSDDGTNFIEYRCRNGMIDVAMPIIIESQHLATFFIGQFFYDNDPPDRTLFLNQAREFGFDPDDYLAALDRVPLFSREYIRANLTFLHSMVKILAESGLKSLKLANEIKQRRLFEERYALFGFALDHVREAAFLMDENGRFQYVNQEACHSLGYSRNELIGMTIPDIDPDYSSDMVNTRLNEQGTEIIETRHMTRDGHIFPVEITSTLFERNGIRYNLALARDISERKRAEEQIRSSRDFFECIINTIADPVFVKDAEHRLVLANDALCDLAGCPREELLGKSDYDFFPREQVDLFWRVDDLVLASGELNINEELITDAAGLLRTIVTHKSRYVDPHGNRFVVGVIRDITQRKQMEEQLREALHFTEGIINAIPDLLFEFDRDGRYLSIWTQKPELLVAPKEVMLGRTVYDMLSPAAASIAMSSIREAEETGLSSGNILRIDLPQGPRWFERSVSRKSGGDSSDVRFIVLSRDVTERVRMETELRESEARYRESSNLLASILESASSVSVYALDRQYRYLAFNRYHWEGMNYLWGGNIDVGMSMLDAIANDESREVSQRGFDEVLTGHSLSVETKHVIVKDGRQVSEYFENYGSPIFNDDGDVVGLTVFTINITERKHAEKELALLNHALDHTHESAFLIDEHFRILYVNAEACKILDFSREELLGMRVSDITPDMSEEILHAGWLNVKAKGVLTMETRHRTRDGRMIPVESSYSYLEFQGQAYCLNLARDITERKRMDEELRRREQEFRTLVENSPDTIARYGRDLRRLYVNPTFAAMVEGGTAALLGKTPAESPGGPSAALYEQKQREVFSNGKAVEFEMKWSNRNNGEVCDLIKLVPEFGKDGAVESILAIGHDITHLREAELKLAKLVETSPGVLFNFLRRQDGSFCVPYASYRIVELFGLRPEEVAEDVSEAFARVHPDDEQRNMESIMESARTLSPWHQEFRILHPDKGEVWVEGNAIPETQSDGGILWYGFLHDITGRKRSEEALLAKRQQLAALVTELSLAEERERQKIAALLHDHIGQTLLLVRIKLGTLAQEVATEPEKKTAEEAKELLDQVSHDIHNLTVQMNPPILSVVGLEAALEWLGRRMEEDFGLFVEFEDDMREKPLMDEVRSVVYQCARELLINVSKHANTDYARIVVAREDKCYRLTVEDDGIGFEPATLVPDPSRNCRFGLLSIQIRMERMGGSVIFDSAPGLGSRITLLAPLALNG